MSFLSKLVLRKPRPDNERDMVPDELRNGCFRHAAGAPAGRASHSDPRLRLSTERRDTARDYGHAPSGHLYFRLVEPQLCLFGRFRASLDQGKFASAFMRCFASRQTR